MGPGGCCPTRSKYRLHDKASGPNISGAMKDHIGINVSMKETALTIRRGGRRVWRVWRGKCVSDPKRIARNIPKTRSLGHTYRFRARCLVGLVLACLECRGFACDHLPLFSQPLAFRGAAAKRLANVLFSTHENALRRILPRARPSVIAGASIVFDEPIRSCTNR